MPSLTVSMALLVHGRVLFYNVALHGDLGRLGARQGALARHHRLVAAAVRD